jgi:hypothetical protein
MSKNWIGNAVWYGSIGLAATFAGAAYAKFEGWSRAMQQNYEYFEAEFEGFRTKIKTLTQKEHDLRVRLDAKEEHWQWMSAAKSRMDAARLYIRSLSYQFESFEKMIEDPIYKYQFVDRRVWRPIMQYLNELSLDAEENLNQVTSYLNYREVKQANQEGRVIDVEFVVVKR